MNLKHYLSPAKLNLDLRIIGRLPNGYHALESIFTLIDLYDILKIIPNHNGEIILHTPTQGVEPEQDLTVKSAKLLRDFAGDMNLGAEIWLEKNIPMGGGLGGGSSNAATVLLVLNQLWNLQLNQQDLINLGVKLGADVPFFIFGRNAFARGIGEILQDIDIPQQYYLLVQPNEHVATPKIFAHPNLKRNSPSNPNPNWQNLQPLQNNMQEVVFLEYPKVKQVFDLLKEFGECRMTGSGACVFLVCEHLEQAQHIQTQLLPIFQKLSAKSWCVSGLNQHHLF